MVSYSLLRTTAHDPLVMICLNFWHEITIGKFTVTQTVIVKQAHQKQFYYGEAQEKECTKLLDFLKQSSLLTETQVIDFYL